MASLAGKKVLITGATAGIGRAAVDAFVAEGATVIALARSADKLQALASDNVIAIRADVADAASMEAAAAAILEKHGAPDVIVANAGIGADARFEQTSDEIMKRVLEVNVVGVLRTVRPFLPAMVARGSGRILFISSVVGKRGVPSYTAYAASKFALHGMADALRPELWGTGVTVGLICPSSTTSEFETNKLRDGVAQKKTRVQLHPPESVARAIVRMSRWTRREMVLSPEGKLMTVMNWLSPRFMDWVLYKTLVKRQGNPSR